MNLCDQQQVKALLLRHGFRFSKSMGQNFLIDGTVPARIAALSNLSSHTGVLEIGPGIGALTRELASLSQKVVAVELDRTLLPILAETLSDQKNVHIISGDILKMDLSSLVQEWFPGLTPVVCANLPYNITTPVLSAFIDSGCFDTITVMVQREVALRICGVAGSAAYGAFSVYVQYHTEPKLLFDVPPESFVPAPRVTSSVVQLRIRSGPPAAVTDKALFFQVVKAAFAQRRKTLINALSAGFGSRISKEELQSIVAACNLPLDIRGERLDFFAFALLVEKIQKTLKGM